MIISQIKIIPSIRNQNIPDYEIIIVGGGFRFSDAPGFNDVVDFPFDESSGEYTAKKNRTPDKELFRSVGCFFRPNYERGILLYALVSKFDIISLFIHNKH